MICNQSVAWPLLAAIDPTMTPNERAARAEWLRVVDVANEATGVNVDVSVRCTKTVGANWTSYTTDTVPSYKDTGGGCALPELGSVDDAYSFRCETFPSQSGRRRLCYCQVAPPPPWSGMWLSIRHRFLQVWPNDRGVSAPVAPKGCCATV